MKSSKYSKVASKKGAKGEFWFVDPFARDTSRDSFRIKFVNTDDYQVRERGEENERHTDTHTHTRTHAHTHTHTHAHR